MSSKPSKIIGIGWNYAKHVKELKYLAGMKVQKSPLFFLKPPSSITKTSIELPKGLNVHYELELGVYIGKVAKNVLPLNALDYIGGYCLALDMTARNLQSEAKQNGQPWSQSKGYDSFCPISDFIPKSDITNPQALRLELTLIDEMKSSSHDSNIVDVSGDCENTMLVKTQKSRIVQNGSTSSMIYPVSELISFLSKILTLEEGDLILTGTPEGVGQVKGGQVLSGKLFEESSSRLITKMSFPAINRGY